MILDTVIDQQIIRLSVLRNRPECVDEAIHAFRESAKNADHAARIGGWILKRTPFFPAPSEIYDAAVATFREEDMGRPDPHCESCDGTGFEPVWVLETRHRTPGGGAYVTTDRLKSRVQADELRKSVNGMDQIVYDGVAPCTMCRRLPLAPSDSPARPESGKRKKAFDRIRTAELVVLEGGG